MKKNNVLNATDLRNPDINRKDLEKLGFYCKSSVTWADWREFLDKFQKEDDYVVHQLNCLFDKLYSLSKLSRKTSFTYQELVYCLDWILEIRDFIQERSNNE